jgi:biopolymer transport protein ExbB
MPILKDALSFNIQSVTSGKIFQLAAALSFVLLSSIAPASAQTQETAPAVTPAQQTQPAAPATQPNVAPIQQQDRVVQPVSPVAPQPEAPVVAAPSAEENTANAPSPVNSPVEVVDPEQRRDIPHDLSPWGMFMAADWVVKAVMIGLGIASVLTWTVLLAKTLELFGARIRANGTLQIVRKAKTLDEATQGIENKGGPAAMMVRMAKHEMTLSDGVVDHTDGGGIKERVTSVLNRIEVHAGRRMARGTGILATIGSISPFVGLFGTVWGIMNSFISISESQTTNLAIVAPGIAEALLATAIGLVAAIPAVVFYNVFARSITGYRHLLADVASGVERLVSRDLDFRRVPPGAAKANVTLVGR